MVFSVLPCLVPTSVCHFLISRSANTFARPYGLFSMVASSAQTSEDRVAPLSHFIGLIAAVEEVWMILRTEGCNSNADTTFMVPSTLGLRIFSSGLDDRIITVAAVCIRSVQPSSSAFTSLESRTSVANTSSEPPFAMGIFCKC